jgi:hypothetical protein
VNRETRRRAQLPEHLQDAIMRLIIAAMDDERGLGDDLSAERRVALVAAIRTYRAAELAAVEAERDRLREALEEAARIAEEPGLFVEDKDARSERVRKGERIRALAPDTAKEGT